VFIYNELFIFSALVGIYIYVLLFKFSFYVVLFFRIRLVEPQSGIEYFVRSNAFSSFFGITQCLRKQGCESGYVIVLHA